MRLLVLAALVAVASLPAVAQQPNRAGPSSSSAPAVPAPVFNVGIVDIAAILRQSTAAQALQRQMQVEQEKYQILTDQQQRTLQAEEEAIERQRASLSAEVYTQKRREFQERVNRTTTELRLRRRQIDEAFTEASGEINRTLLNVIEELARDQNVQLVVRREAVLYQQAVFDLTEAAGESLNQRLPSISVSLPEP